MSAWPTTRLGAVSALLPDAACLHEITATSTQLCQLGLVCRPMSDAPSRATCWVGGWAHPGVGGILGSWYQLTSGWSHAGVQLSGGKAVTAPSSLEP